jgi:large subunit ribosomal protein L3
MTAMIGQKVGMTQVFDEKTGELFPVTVVKLGPCPVTQVKTKATDGYDAVQIGFGDVRPTVVTMPLRGHFAKANVQPQRVVREFRVDDATQYQVGQTLTVEMFADQKKVDVIGTSRGRGFAGTVKRHKFTTGPKTHGCRNYRAPGSIGSNSTPNRVFKNQRMAGHMGDERVTVRNLRVIGVDAANHLILINGAVPGARNAFLVVRTPKK